MANPAPDYSTAYLLYLYFWPFWMFKDANKGTLLERAAAYRHNREKRVFLPGYIAKWSVIFVVFLSTTLFFDELGRTATNVSYSCSVLACGAGIMAAWAFVVTVVLTVGHLLLCRWDR